MKVKSFRYLAVGLALIILLGVSGNLVAAEEPVTLKFMARGGRVVFENLRKIVAEFERLNPDIKIKTEEVTGEYLQKLQVEIAGGVAPDVVFAAMGDFRILAQKGAFADLARFIERDNLNLSDYYPAAIESGKYRETLYMWPYDGGSYVLEYNKDLFDEAGLPYPDDTWTWDTVLEAALKLTVDRNGRHPGETGFDPGRIVQYGLADISYYWWLLSWANGGDIINEDGTQSTVSSPIVVETVQWMADLKNKYHVMPSSKMPPGFDAGFESGRIAMNLDGRWHVPWVRPAKMNWDVAVVPKGKADRANLAFYSGFVMMNTTEHPDEAWRFIKYVGGPEGQKYLTELGQVVPAYRPLAESDVFMNNTPPDNNEAYLLGMENAKSWPTLYITLWGGEYSQTLDPVLEKVWFGDAQAKDVLNAELDAKLTEFLKRN